MNAERLAMQRRIDNLDRHITYLYGVVSDYERKTARLTVELETVKRERDALKHDLYLECYDSPHACYVCKYGQDGVTKCKRDMDDCFEWRGVQENGGAEDGK